METNDYPPGEFQPRHLSQEEIDNPYLVIEELFSYGQLPEVREQLWAMLKAGVTGNFNELFTPVERSNMFYFYELMAKVVEANYLIRLRQKAAA